MLWNSTDIIELSKLPGWNCWINPKFEYTNHHSQNSTLFKQTGRGRYIKVDSLETHHKSQSYIIHIGLKNMKLEFIPIT